MIQGQGTHAANPSDTSIHTFGAQCAEVEVDVETGEVTVLRVVAAHDCGRIVNPTLVDSQVIGGVTQGLGFALTEERIVDERYGTVVNANLEEYHVPTVLDIPEIRHAQVDLPDPRANPTGAKGIGEPPLIPTAPAIANAIYDAVGVRVRQTPITRQRLLTALATQRASGIGGGTAVPSRPSPAAPAARRGEEADEVVRLRQRRDCRGGDPDRGRPACEP